MYLNSIYMGLYIGTLGPKYTLFGYILGVGSDDRLRHTRRSSPPRRCASFAARRGRSPASIRALGIRLLMVFAWVYFRLYMFIPTYIGTY